MNTPTPPQPQVHAASFAAFTAAHPAEAALLQTAVTVATQQIEAAMPTADGALKAKEAERLTIEMLRNVYNGADLFLNLHPAIDFIALEFLIPLVPKAIDGVVKFFNDMGIFKHGSN